jgi:hypothetical protein
VQRTSVRSAPEALAVTLLLCLSACASAQARPRAPTAADASPADIVFLIHGIWPDGSWCTEAATAFESAKIPVVPVTYSTFLVGFMFGFGTDEPADQLVSFVRDLEAEHAKTGCRAPVRYHAVAYSAGTVVTLKAAWQGVKFATAHFGGSPIPAFSPEIADAVRAKEIGEVTNYWSIFDGVTGWGWGAGSFGYHAYEDTERLAIKNVPLAYHHLVPPFDAELCGAIARNMRASRRAASGPAHACSSDRAFSAWWARRAAGASAPPPTPASGP